MSDFLLDLSRNRGLKKALAAAGVSPPLPEPLRRQPGPVAARPLEGRVVGVGVPDGARVVATLAAALPALGASVEVAGDASPFRGPAEAYGRQVATSGDGALDGLVLDATGLERADDLVALHAFFQPRVARLARSGKVVVVARAGAPIVARAVVGLAKSLGKELGKRGGTANVILVRDGADASVAGPLAFFLSSKSAFVSGQVLTVGPGGAPSRPRSLDGQVAVVTGAARGIGKDTARALAAEGAWVLCVDRPDDDAETSKVARSIGGGALGLDVTDPAAAEKLLSALGDRAIHVLVHNAGVTRDRTLARMKEADFSLAIDVSLGGVVRITERVLEAKRLAKGGRVIALSSIAGIAGNLGQTNYAAAKAGVIGYVESLAQRVAADGVTVNAIAPGFIETRMTAVVPLFIREAGRRLSSLSQGGLPADVADAITFLATPAAGGVTGQVLRVCGQSFLGA